MDYNDNEETTLNLVNTLNQGVWRRDTQMCEQGQMICPEPKISQSVNKNDVKIPSTAEPNQPLRMAETKSQPVVLGLNPQDNMSFTDYQFTIKSNNRSSSENQPIRLSFTNSQQIQLSSSSSSDSSDSSKTTTWGQLKTQLPKEMQNDSKCQTSEHSPKCSPTKDKNKKAMTSWKSLSPTKSSSSSDSDKSNHSSHSNEYANNIFRFSCKKKDFSDSTSSNSDADTGQQETCLTRQQESHEHSNEIQVVNQSPEKKCLSKTESPIKKSLNCSGNCNSQHPDNQNNLINSNTSLCENDNDSPKKEKGVDGSADDVCDNEYFYEDDFTVQFDTNLRESSLTPRDTDQNTTILDFPNMVTGSYLCFHNGGSSNISLNNSKASSNVSLDNLRVSNIINNQGKSMQYDSELSGNSGSHNSTMETSSSDKDMQGSSDIIELSDGPLFTPTPSNILSTDSLDKGSNNVVEAQMSGSNGSGVTNLNVNCCPRKEEYFLSFDGSHSRVSGSETDVSVSLTSQDSYQDHMGQRKTNVTSHKSGQPKIGEVLDDLSGSDGQDESDCSHVCFNKLSPKHKGSHYSGCENLSGTFVKKLIPLNQTVMGATDSSEEENTRTSTTLTAGSKDLSSISPQFSPKKKLENHLEQPVSKFKKNNSRNSEPLFLVGIGKPVEIMSKTGVHSHTLPKVKKLVSWRQLKHFRKAEKSKCISLPELSTSTSWKNISALRCKNISELCESFHGKRHSASLLEFYQRMKSESNPVSPETMNNLEQILWPNFLDQKYKPAEASDSSHSSHECTHCQCRKKVFAEIQDSGLKAYTNKRIFDWLKMECSASSKDSQRPHSLACQAGPFTDYSSKETLVSPETVALWCETKTVSSQFPPVTKDCSIQTLQSLQNSKDNMEFKEISKKDQALQTSDFEAEEIMSILSDTFEEFTFLKSNEEIAKELLSCPEIVFERNSNKKICRSKSFDGRKSNTDRLVNCSSKSYEQGINHIGRSRSVGGLARKSVAPGRRMGINKHYSYQSLPDIAFLSSSLTNDKDESNDSLFDAVKIDLDVPVTIATKTELEQFNIYQQKTYPCHHHHRPTCCAGNKNRSKSSETASSSSGVSSWSGSTSTDTGSCDCRSRSAESPQNDLERLIFYPPHTEKFKASLDCFASKKRAHSLPSKLSECAAISVNPKMEKYANEMHPHSETGSKCQYRISQKWTSCSKNPEPASSENLYALEEEQTPVASPDQQPCFHRSKCQRGEQSEQTDCNKCGFFKTNQEFTESDFYRAVQEDKIIIVGNDCYRGIQVVGIDSTSSSGSSVPNSDRKPLKSCLRKKNRGLKSRSLSAADAMALNFEDLEEKVRNHRHSFGCDEVYIVADEHGQLMMYQADDHAEPVMFYLGKDGECHMTEGHGNHMENFGSLANFNIQANNSIQGVGDSLTEQEGNSGKRKSVSFASEVSFQSISPIISPRNLVVCNKPAESGFEKLILSEDNLAVAGTVLLETGKYIVRDIGVDEVKDEDQGTTLTGSTGQHEEQVSSSSSSESAPEEFHVAMDTSDNFCLEDMAQEKIGLLISVSKAAEVLVAHFAKSIDTFDKLRLGNTSDCPELGVILMKLCNALTHVLEDGLKQHLTGFQMFGRVQITVWKVVEASVEIVPQTRSLCDLVCKVKHTTYLMTHQQKFDAFVFGLLNLRLLDFWMQYICQKEDQLAKFYSSGALLIHSNNALKKQYNDVIVAVQSLALLPFHLDTEYIKEKALVDSKLKTSDVIVLSNSTAMMTTSLSESSSGSYSSAKEASSVLEITASKALSWLSNIALPKIKTSTEYDFLASKSLPFESASHSANSDNTVCHISESISFQGKEKDINEHHNENEELKRLFEIYQQIYFDANISKIDCDAIISLTESSRSSHNSQTGFKSFLSAMAARFGENPVNQSLSLTQSMTNSASHLVSHLWGTSKQACKKVITEYKFDEVQDGKTIVGLKYIDAEDKSKVDNVISSETSQTYVQENIEVNSRDRKSDSVAETTKAKHVSFDIVNLFDKLLLPNCKIEKTDSKPVSRIPVPTNRWSWSFGASKPVTTSPVKLPKAATDTDLKLNNHTNKQMPKIEPSHLSKTEQLYPKRNCQLMDTTKGVNLAQVEKSKVVAPPKPPRAVSTVRVGTKKTLSSLASNPMATL